MISRTNVVNSYDIKEVEHIYPKINSTFKLTTKNNLCFKKLNSERIQEALDKEVILTQLFHAVQNGFIDCLKLVSPEIWISFIDARHSVSTLTLLHEAALSRKPELLEFILSKKPKINEKTSKGNTALHLTVKLGCVNCVNILCAQKGLDFDSQDQKGQTPLDLACRLNSIDIVKVLLNCGANPMKAEFDGMTCLHHPMRTNNVELVELLLNANCSPETKNNNGISPIALAINMGNMEAFSVCVKKYNGNISSILNSQDGEGYSCTLNAVRHKQKEMFLECIKLGADISMKQNEGRNALHIASEIGWIDIIPFICNYGCDINCVDNNMNTALHLAVHNGQISIVEYLLKRGANTNVCNMILLTPLLLVVTNISTTNLEIVLMIMNILLQHNANVLMKNRKKENILHLLIKHDQIIAIESLFKCINYENKQNLLDSHDGNGDTPLHVACKRNLINICIFLVQEGANINVGNFNENLPIHEAAKKGNLEIVKYLIEQNEDQLCIRNENEENLILIAVQSGHYEIFEYLFSRDNDLHCKDESGNNILMYASEIGNIAMVDLILNKDFNIHMRNYQQSSPLHLAAAAGQNDMVQHLLNIGAELCENILHQTALTLALDNQHWETARIFLNDRNWKKTMEFKFKNGKNHFESIITKNEDIAYELLDRGVTVENNSPMNNSTTYQLSLLDKGPSDTSNVNGRHNDLTIIGQHKKERLISHPLSQMLIARKWVLFGMYIWNMDFAMYILYLILLNCIIFQRIPSTSANMTDNNGCPVNPATKEMLSCSRYELSINIFLLVVLYIRLVLELWKFYSEKYRYFRRYDNFPFWILYVCTLVFISNPNSLPCSFQWNFGIIAICLSWSLPMLYLQNVPVIGIPILMFKTVVVNVLKILLLFLNTVIGYTITFYVLNQNQLPFQNMVYSLVKVYDMMIGELDYASYFVDSNFSQFSVIKLIAILTFIILIPISMINLMVGLAVGDIDRMMKDANLSMLIRQVSYLSEIEATLPVSLQTKFYESIYVDKVQIERKKKIKI